MHDKTDPWILMKEKGNIFISGKRIFLLIILIISGGFITGVTAQPNPPRPVIVTFNPSQPLAFGAFTPGLSGGTVTVFPDGSRSSTVDVVLLSLGYIFTPAMFYVRANPGTILSILVNPPVTLNGSLGGTITLQTGGTLPKSPFVTTLPWPQQTTVLLGGTLTVGNIGANPAGSYTGSFNITFVQE
jgi:hypothetical protein